MDFREQLLRVSPALRRGFREGHLAVALAGLQIEAKPHHPVRRELLVLRPHAFHVVRRDVAKSARGVRVALHPRNDWLAEASRETAHVAHVERDAVIEVRLGDRVGVEMDEVKLPRQQFLSGAVVVVLLAPCVAARRVAKHLHGRRHRAHALNERTRDVRAALVELIERVAVRRRTVDFRITPRARLDESRRGGGERGASAFRKAPDREARGGAVQPAGQVEAFVAEADCDNVVCREHTAVGLRPQLRAMPADCARGIRSELGKHRKLPPAVLPALAVGIALPVDGDANLVEHQPGAVREVEL